MKISIIAPYLTTKGGASRFTWELSEYLSNIGDSVTLFSLYTDRKLFPEKKNLRIIDIANEKNLTQSIKFWLNLGKIKKRLKDLVEEENLDAVLFMNFPATLWAQKFGKKAVLCYPQDINLLYTNTYIKNLPILKYLIWIILRRFVRRIDKKAWMNFDLVVCPSKFSEKQISSKYNVPTKVVHIGTKTEHFKPNNTKKQKAILSIAALKTQRAEFLIESLEKLLKKRKDFEIWMVGSKGDYHSELQELVSKLNLEKYVRFFGRVTDSKLIELFSQALVVTHLVKQPPFGLIVTEAMACETPVIACHPGGTDESIIHNETGFLIDEEDKNSLIEYIKKFLDEPGLSNKMGIKGRERVQKYFELNSKCEELRQFILEWIKKKSKYSCS